MRRLFVGLALSLFASWAAAQPLALSTGGIVYAPVYSHILYGNLDSAGQPPMLLVSATLSVRNVDPKQSLTIQSVAYFATDGQRIREHLTQPLTLAPLASTEFFVELRDTTGGTGAKFLATWRASQPINPPLIETMHTYIAGTQSAVFISPSRAIRVD